MLEQTNVPSVLAPFYDDFLIDELLYVVKSGKEATVYACKAHPSTGVELLAAKVYRGRNDRSFRNDAVYQEGRYIADKRLRKAFAKKSNKGKQVQFATWVTSEYVTLETLHATGSDVPRPYAQAEGAILMEYVGDADGPAPPLRGVRLQPEEVGPLFERLLHNIALWLAAGWVHGDLSAFNVLYWEGGVKVIDFPQAVEAQVNRNAFALLERDVSNICTYFARYGLVRDPARLAHELWRRHASDRPR